MTGISPPFAKLTVLVTCRVLPARAAGWSARSPPASMSIVAPAGALMARPSDRQMDSICDRCDAGDIGGNGGRVVPSQPSMPTVDADPTAAAAAPEDPPPGRRLHGRREEGARRDEPH